MKRKVDILKSLKEKKNTRKQRIFLKVVSKQDAMLLKINREILISKNIAKSNMYYMWLTSK